MLGLVWIITLFVWHLARRPRIVCAAGPRRRVGRTTGPIRIRQRPGPPHERDAPWQPNAAGEVAGLLYVSPKTVSRWAKEGKLPFMKTLGGHRRYPEAEIRELAEELRQEPTA